MTVPLPSYTAVSQKWPGLKGFAILGIVMFHLWNYTQGSPTVWELGQRLQASPAQILKLPLDLLCLLGEQGVHLFLIASGFGLAASWWRRYGQAAGPRPPWRTFWWRRLGRIFPLYWSAHGLALVLLWLAPRWVPYGQDCFTPISRLLSGLFLSLTTLNNLVLTCYYFLNGAWWYVGLAVQLYLIFPLTVGAGRRWGWSRVLLAALGLSLAYRLVVMALPLAPAPTEMLLRGAWFPSRLFEFVLGEWLAIALLAPATLSPQGRTWLTWLLGSHRWPLFLGLGGLGLAGHWLFWAGWEWGRIPADALIGLGELGVLMRWLPVGGGVGRLLAGLGNYSYGIFLTHMNFYVGGWILLTPLVPSYWLRFAGVLGLTLALGVGFEELGRWLQRWQMRPSAP